MAITSRTALTSAIPMDQLRRTALLAGALYLITFIELVSRPGSPSKEQKARLLQRARNSPDFRFLSGTG
ncbi:hypothetical protein [Geodermatophilus amargosae]|uniref:hypothetical protein n=1 Tax=Geodermatophilus amargosae TaxID=1296565 RepID=UPI000B88E9B4|nr:hypothetical protein [Geodermatophilus amargosae]